MVGTQKDFFRRVRHPSRLPVPYERSTHIAVADLLRAECKPGWFWSHIGHGEARSEATGKLLKRMGLRPGLLDFLLISPDGAHYWLEIKRGLAPTTEGQDDFTAMCRERGIPYFIARSYEAAEQKLRAWGAI